MRKVIVMMGMLIGVLVSVKSVSAFQPDPDRGVTVYMSDCEYTDDYTDSPFGYTFSGGYDVLVLKEEAGSFGIFGFGPTVSLTEFYPQIEEFSYLEEDYGDYVPFVGLYIPDDDKVEYRTGENYECGVNLGYDEDFEHFTSIKLVHFDDNGNLVFVSEAMDIPQARGNQNTNLILHYDVVTQTVTNDMETSVSFLHLLGRLLLIFLAAQVVVVKVIVAYFFRFKEQQHFILYIASLNMVLFYVIGSFFIDSNTPFNDTLLLVSLMFGYVGLETLITYIVYRETIQIEKLLQFELISNGLFIIMGIALLVL